MASVDLWTAGYTDTVFGENIVDGDVVGNNLILTKRNGGTVDAGVVVGPQGAAGSVGLPWNSATAYTVGQYAGQAGIIWRCIQAGTNKPPIMFGSYWQQVTGADVDVWAQKDPYFQGDSIANSWEQFWKTGTVTSSLTTTAGEFESGKQALKLVMSANSTQTLYTKNEENVVRGGETILVYVRAKLRVAAAGVTLKADLNQNDATGAPTPLASGLVVTASAQGLQTLTTTWQTFGFAVGAVNAKPRATLVLQAATGANAADVLIDRVEIRRSKLAPLVAPDTDWITLPLTAGAFFGGDFTPPRYKREDGFVYVEGLIGSLGGGLASGSIFANLPVGFRPLYRFISLVINTQALGRVDVQTNGNLSTDIAIPVNGWFSINLTPFKAEA